MLLAVIVILSLQNYISLQQINIIVCVRLAERHCLCVCDVTGTGWSALGAHGQGHARAAEHVSTGSGAPAQGDVDRGASHPGHRSAQV